jgi:cytoskeletal protein CcmA (bactofilin family)
MNSAEGTTIIGANTKVMGELSGTDSLLIEGEVEGSITLPGGRVTVGEQGRVRANIFAQDILISGRVHGDLQATGSVQLRASSMVLGDIIAPRFTMEEDSLLRGHVEPASPPAPAAASSGGETPRTTRGLPVALAVIEPRDGGSSTTAGSDAPSHS